MPNLDPADPDVWRTVRTTVARARSSALHCAIASTMPDGSAHVSPIGSVSLGEPGCGTYLDVFNAQLGRNLDHDPRLTILAVDSRKVMWVRALLRGRFETPPGLRLRATAGPTRPATEGEVDRFRRAVKPAVLTKGGQAMWGRPEALQARDLVISEIVPVRIGTMTRNVWSAPATTG